MDVCDVAQRHHRGLQPRAAAWLDVPFLNDGRHFDAHGPNTVAHVGAARVAQHDGVGARYGTGDVPGVVRWRTPLPLSRAVHTDPLAHTGRPTATHWHPASHAATPSGPSTAASARGPSPGRSTLLPRAEAGQGTASRASAATRSRTTSWRASGGASSLRGTRSSSSCARRRCIPSAKVRPRLALLPLASFTRPARARVVQSDGYPHAQLTTSSSSSSRSPRAPSRRATSRTTRRTPFSRRTTASSCTAAPTSPT